MTKIDICRGKFAFSSPEILESSTHLTCECSGFNLTSQQTRQLTTKNVVNLNGGILNLLYFIIAKSSGVTPERGTRHETKYNAISKPVAAYLSDNECDPQACRRLYL